MDPTTNIILLKLLPAKYADDFLDGNLFCNPAAYFASIDSSDAERYDGDEGAAEAWQFAKIEVLNEKTARWVELGGAQSPAIYRDDSFDGLNILCLYAMTDRPGDDFDERLTGFGDTAVLLTDLQAFISRVKAAASAQGKSLRYGPIEYVQREPHHGQMGPFKKFAALAHQNEFRFVLTGGNGEACRLQIGDIRDIAFTLPSSNVLALQQGLRQRSQTTAEPPVQTGREH